MNDDSLARVLADLLADPQIEEILDSFPPERAALAARIRRANAELSAGRPVELLTTDSGEKQILMPDLVWHPVQ